MEKGDRKEQACSVVGGLGPSIFPEGPTRFERGRRDRQLEAETVTIIEVSTIITFSTSGGEHPKDNLSASQGS